MKRVVILQKYLAPYRVSVFNAIADHPGIDLTLLYYGTLEARRKWSVYPERHFNEVQTRCFPLWKTYNSNYELPLSLLNHLKSLKPDLIVCAPDIGGLAAWLMKKIHGCSYAIWSEATAMTERSRGKKRKWFRSFLYRHAESFLVPGKLSADYIRSICAEACLFYVNNAIEEQLFSLMSEEIVKKFAVDQLIITFSGSLIEKKGVKHLLEAFDGLLKRRPDLKKRCLLRLLGTGPLEVEPYRSDNVRFEGFCEGDHYRNFMKASHIFVLPSLSDCNPLTVIEALFAGNVLILSDFVGNAPEALQGNGLMVPAVLPKELEKAIEALLNKSKEELISMALRSRELADRFSIANSVAGFLKSMKIGDDFKVATSK